MHSVRVHALGAGAQPLHLGTGVQPATNVAFVILGAQYRGDSVPFQRVFGIVAPVHRQTGYGGTRLGRGVFILPGRLRPFQLVWTESDIGRFTQRNGSVRRRRSGYRRTSSSECLVLLRNGFVAYRAHLRQKIADGRAFQFRFFHAGDRRPEFAFRTKNRAFRPIQKLKMRLERGKKNEKKY